MANENGETYLDTGELSMASFLIIQFKTIGVFSNELQKCNIHIVTFLLYKPEKHPARLSPSLAIYLRLSDRHAESSPYRIGLS